MAKKIATKTTASKIEGTRIAIDKDAYKGLPAVRFPSDGGHVTVVGVGKTGMYCGWKKQKSATKHRRGFTLVGNALIVGHDDPSGLTIAKFLAQHGLTVKADAGKLSTLPLPTETDKRRWATAAETAAYVKAECEMRRKMLNLAVAFAQKQKRQAEKMLADADKALEAYDALNV